MVISSRKDSADESRSNRSSLDFQFALQEEIQRLLESGMNLEECLRRFPSESELIQKLYQSKDQDEGRETLITDGGESVESPSPSPVKRASGKQAQPVAPQQTAGSQKIGRYEIRKFLGAGSFGNVYQAYDPKLDLIVALKVPIQGAFRGTSERERFFREGRSAVSIRHPSICPVYDVGETENGEYFLVLGFIDGESLAEKLSENGIPNSQKAADWVMQIADAMAEAHRQGVIHRDLKPANIMLDSRSRPVVMDFGLARRDSSDDASLTQQGQVLGTPAYMAPEQARGDQREVGPASDIYSLGAIFYELLTGRRPYLGRLVDVLSQIGQSTPPPVPHSINANVDPVLEQICIRAMSQVPTERWTSMEELRDALQLWLDDYEFRNKANRQLPTVDYKKVDPQVTFWRRRVIRAAVLLSVLAFVYLAGVTYVSTRQGTIKIAVDDPRAEVHVDGREIEIKNLDQPLKLWVGEHVLEVRNGSVLVETRRFQINHGPNRSIEVSYQPKSQLLHPVTEQGAAQLKSDSQGKPDLSNRPRVAPDEPIIHASDDLFGASTRESSPQSIEMQVATWVFANRGTVIWRLGTGFREATQIAELPTSDWKLTGIRMREPVRWDDQIRMSLSLLPNLDFLELQNSTMQDIDYEVLPQIKTLTALAMTGGRINVAQLRSLGTMKQLTSLQLSSSEITSLDMLLGLQNLTVLWITGPPASSHQESGPKLNLGSVGSLQNLNDFSLNGLHLTEPELAGLSKLPKLARLHLSNTNLSDRGIVLLTQCDKLQYLELDLTDVTDVGMRPFLKATKSRLYGISAAGVKLTDEGLESLRDCELLLDVNVPGTEVTDRLLKSLSNCSQLSSLWLTNCHITDAGVAAISRLRQMSNLDLGNTQVTDSSVKHLGEFKRLRFLGIQNTKISAKAYEILREKLPQCHIEW